jgi:hypothetical protein
MKTYMEIFINKKLQIIIKKERKNEPYNSYK